jgi:hypothetical protein
MMTGRYWIEYHNRKLDNSTGPALGSDGFQPLDGRYGLATAHRIAKERAEALNKGYTGYRIMAGAKASTAVAVTTVRAL